MPDLSELLSRVMSNPQMMEQMSALAQGLGLQGEEETGQLYQEPPPPSQEPQQDPARLMGSLIQMAGAMGGDDRQLALIRALKPFLRPERVRKLEKAIQVAKMSRLAEQALHTLGKQGGKGVL